MGEVIGRFERRGLRVSGMKMMQLSDDILREHYAHLADKPFFPSLAASMQTSPVVAMALSGVDAVKVVRQMCGVTNGRDAAPGTIRGDLSMSNQQNIVHASDSVENPERKYHVALARCHMIWIDGILPEGKGRTGRSWLCWFFRLRRMCQLLEYRRSGQQFFVGARGYQSSSVQNQNTVAVANGGKTMGDHD